MKTIFACMLLVVAANAFAQGSSNLSCTSNEGISFSNISGFGEITIDSVKSDAEIQNYSFGDESITTKVSWIGEATILSETQENTCNRDYVATIFSQKVEVNSKIVNVVCTDELITSSGAEVDECLE